MLVGLREYLEGMLGDPSLTHIQRTTYTKSKTTQAKPKQQHKTHIYIYIYIHAQNEIVVAF